MYTHVCGLFHVVSTHKKQCLGRPFGGVTEAPERAFPLTKRISSNSDLVVPGRRFLGELVKISVIYDLCDLRKWGYTYSKLFKQERFGCQDVSMLPMIVKQNIIISSSVEMWEHDPLLFVKVLSGLTKRMSLDPKEQFEKLILDIR